MDNAIFQWDDHKAKINLHKHGVDFEEGVTVFNDPLLATMPDAEHSENEQRFVSIGISVKGTVLVIVYTERNEKTRIISCRKATKSEVKFYENI
jgi:uncharacterized DUF497 family protein